MTEPDMSILAIHPGALGDVILFGHLLAAIRDPHSAIRNPQSSSPSVPPRPQRITLVAGGSKARLLAGAGVVDAAVDFDCLPMHELFSDTPLDQCRLPAMLGRCGRIISCFVEADSLPARRLMRMCGAGELTALPIRPPAPGAPKRDDFGGHLTELWRRQFGLAGRIEAATWTIPPAWLTDASGALKRLGVDAGGRYVVIHPGAGSPDKCWAMERFLDVAASLGSSGMDVVFALGPVELERWPRKRISLLRDAASVLADAPLTQLAGVLAGAAALLGNDSGAAHLAAAVGAPTVAMFGPTSPTHFAPLGRSVTCLSGDTMDDIATSRVIDAVGKLCGA
jgi:hypothetical protein